MFFSTHTVEQVYLRYARYEALRSKCVPFVSVFGATPFEGSIATRAVGRFLCSRISQTAGSSFRSTCEIERGDPAEYMVLLQLSGRSRVEQSGRTAQMVPGAVTVIDSSCPSRCTFEGKNVQLAFHMPKQALHELTLHWNPDLASLAPQSSSALVGALMSSAFEVVRSTDRARADIVARTIVSLLNGGLTEKTDLRLETQASGSLLGAIQGFVIGHLSEGTLSPKSIARFHGISERKVHRLFKASGLSVSQWIKQRRLDRCAAQLRDPAMVDQSITEIAFRWGFNDAAHFSRAFRAEFSQTPRDFRAVAMARRGLPPSRTNSLPGH